MKRACIISGGGSWGAFTVGKLNALNNSYDVVIGSSTGALMSPFVALGEWEKLKELYTTITYDEIFNVSPFKKNGKINYFNIIWRLVRGKLTLGENKNLFKLIKKHFTEEMYNQIISSDKDVIITVCDITNRKTKYVSIRDYSYDSFCMYMWASASFPLVCDVVNIDGIQYIDGGTLENSPLDYTLRLGVTSVDVFCHNTKYKIGENVSSIFNLIIRVIEVMRGEIVRNDLNAIELNLMGEILVNMYDLDFEPSNSYLTFDPVIMKKWFDIGFNSIKK